MHHSVYCASAICQPTDCRDLSRVRGAASQRVRSLQLAQQCLRHVLCVQGVWDGERRMPGHLQPSQTRGTGKEHAQSPREAWQAPQPPPVRTRVPDEAGPQVEICRAVKDILKGNISASCTWSGRHGHPYRAVAVSLGAANASAVVYVLHPCVCAAGLHLMRSCRSDDKMLTVQVCTAQYPHVWMLSLQLQLSSTTAARMQS